MLSFIYEFIKYCSINMSIIDLSWNENLRNRYNSPLLPRSIRGLIIGKSGCGKTNLIMNLLPRDGFLDYNTLKLFGKSLFQNEYQIIKEAFQCGIPKEYIVELFVMRDEILRNREDPIKILQSHNLPLEVQHSQVRLRYARAQKSTIQCEFFENASDVPDPADLDKTCKNLMLFDDLQLEKQNT
jgi:hypothetical protein